ncbi:ABC transporter ATP-binding protein [Patulibacter brassicae]|jgi:ABC-type polysaccharide/polyol phosphate transport system ATPase subunit|uniref:ABC transporter ATP-binding protein n=1 Tax=Patulibacter brassicae TaxID=1705717 RepID=A0ABU4VIX6_9ACTN|nr:ABC transporter ATP-binding protein [Patulibacter brassicae]MDX8151649.1 ABC transporter ATP-binding protein [Patulibacter brassicae]
MADVPLAVSVSGLHKTFRIAEHQVSTLKERALHPLRRTAHHDLEILRGIDFDVRRGEFFGIVGRNGSGKSTLLKCLAGIYTADQGTIRIGGRLAPFIELGVGFNPDLTAYENVQINAVMMGLSPREARERFDEIIAFAELEDYLDLKLKNYSSGMQVRLAFAVMVQADADVMLVDEVLAVGDAAFQQKCLDVFWELREQGKTIILVTHDMATVERFCHRAMFIRQGEIELLGDPRQVGLAYLDANFGRTDVVVADSADSPAVTLNAAWVESEGEKVDHVQSGEHFVVHMDLSFHVATDHGYLVVELLDELGNPITGVEHGLTPTDAGLDGTELPGGANVVVRCGFRPQLADGSYTVRMRITRGVGRQHVLADVPEVAQLVVHGADHVVGAVGVPRQVHLTATLPSAEPIEGTA